MDLVTKLCLCSVLTVASNQHSFNSRDTHIRYIIFVFIYFQCFVCRKKYVIQFQLKNHLSTVHGIQYPEMICKICFIEFIIVMEEKAHERKHDKIYSCQYCSTKSASLYFCQKHYDKHLADMKPYQCMSYVGRDFRTTYN